MSRKEKDCRFDSTKRKPIEGKQCPLLKKLKADGLECDYYQLYTKKEADEYLDNAKNNWSSTLVKNRKYKCLESGMKLGENR